MVLQRLAMTALAMVSLASTGLLLAADEAKPATDRLDAAMDKVSLSDRQKQMMKKICADFDEKAGPLINKLCVQRREHWDAMVGVLTEEQRTKLPTAVKKSVDKEQTQRVATIRAEFWKKFQSLCPEKGEKKGADISREYRHLWMEALAKASEFLTKEQRAKLIALQRKEFNEWHDHTLRDEHMKSIADQLGLSAEQRKKINDLCSSHGKKCDEPRDKLAQLCKEGCASMEKVLTADQRAKLPEMFPFTFLNTEHKEKE
jgi:Spy/CpxP family protein refolding chaperone